MTGQVVAAVAAGLAGALAALAVAAAAGRLPVVAGDPPGWHRGSRGWALAAAGGATWAGLLVHFGSSWTVPPEAALCTALVVLTAVDVDRYLLPRAIVYPALVVVSALLVTSAAATGAWHRLAVAAACGAGTWAVFLLLHLARPAWMGFGDVRLAALIGAGVGWLGPSAVLLALVVTNVAAAVTGIVLMAAGRATRSTPLPYGAFLTVGAVATLLATRP